jgi:regulation of enolase protein 1 (concanavalin A-like superfamily)
MTQTETDGQQTVTMSSMTPDLAHDSEPVWLNEPARWRRSGADLLMTTDPRTDFWRQTHYGFIRDSGHHFGVRVPGDFTAEVEVLGDYADQFDQAGLMVRMDAERWVKCGIEYVDGGATMGAVVTHAVSDWSMTRLAAVPGSLRLRLRRDGDALTIEYQVADTDSTDETADEAEPAGEQGWIMHRMAYLPAALPVSVGPMAASPSGDGFEVRFRGLRIDSDSGVDAGAGVRKG